MIESYPDFENLDWSLWLFESELQTAFVYIL